MKSAHKVKQLMTSKPVVLRGSDSLLKAAETFSQHKISGAPVVDESGVLVGVISQGDLTREVSQGPFSDFGESIYFVGLPYVDDDLNAPLTNRLDTLNVEDAMQQGAIAVTAEDDVALAAKCMRDNRVHRVIVVDSQSSRKVVGILSALDVLKILE